jgi:anti-sigma B factor antagonist
MEKSEFHSFEINSAKGLAQVQAPEQIIGGRESLALMQIISGLDKEITYFVIELGSVTAINSTGLGTLISAHRTLTQKGIKLFLLNPSQKIKELMAITHLDRVFTFVGDISEI